MLGIDVRKNLIEIGHGYLPSLAGLAGAASTIADRSSLRRNLVVQVGVHAQAELHIELIRTTFSEHSAFIVRCPIIRELIRADNGSAQRYASASVVDLQHVPGKFLLGLVWTDVVRNMLSPC